MTATYIASRILCYITATLLSRSHKSIFLGPSLSFWDYDAFHCVFFRDRRHTECKVARKLDVSVCRFCRCRGSVPLADIEVVQIEKNSITLSETSQD